MLPRLAGLKAALEAGPATGRQVLGELLSSSSPSRRSQTRPAERPPGSSLGSALSIVFSLVGFLTEEHNTVAKAYTSTIHCFCGRAVDKAVGDRTRFDGFRSLRALRSSMRHTTSWMENQVQVKEVGVGWTRDEQVAAALEVGVRVVVVEPLTRVLSAATECAAIDDGARGVGRSVGAVGP